MAVPILYMQKLAWEGRAWPSSHGLLCRGEPGLVLMRSCFQIGTASQFPKDFPLLLWSSPDFFELVVYSRWTDVETKVHQGAGNLTKSTERRRRKTVMIIEILQGSLL